MLMSMEDDAHNRTELDTDTWSTLGALTTQLLNKTLGTPFVEAVAAATPSVLSEKKKDRCGNDRASTQGEKGAEECQREYVEQRLRDFRAFEAKASGKIG